MEKRVIGIGGIFFKTENHQATRDWYAKHLGIESEKWGATFDWVRPENPEAKTYTAWSPFAKDTTYFLPSEKSFMINYQVENLKELLDTLRSEGVTVLAETEESEFGKFGWIIDLDGNKIELWQPPDKL
jgi:predicted enzyme related to lactoylglutathione lyase